jgi:hypothetical protein
MISANRHHRSVILKLSFCFLLVLALAACVDKTDKGTASTDTVASTDAKPTTTDRPTPQTMGLLGTHLDTLMLDSTKYKNLRGKFPPTPADKTKLVVQFYFNSANTSNPSLIAYASKPGNRYRFGIIPNPFSVVLDHGGQAFQLPAEFVLGDQQIRFEDIDPIIGGATDFVLYFIPTIKPGEINVRYNICIRKGSGAVVCLAPPPPTQPSPPANAN